MDEGTPASSATRGDSPGRAPSLPWDGAAGSGSGAQRRRSRSLRTLVVAALALTVLSGAAGGLIGASLERTGGLETVQLPQPGPPLPARPPGDAAGIAARALPSVVTLHVTGTGAGDQATAGTGLVLDSRGRILTNDHVVAPALSAGGRITVTFSSGATARATLVGRDAGYDLAVVQVHGVHGLTPLPLGGPRDHTGSPDRN
ncbi:trypsin-like peptidase domain-containing protein [Streptomyces sp. NPDC051987]|uniref:trypsin-like peptidase domain-containing protein n=1 Tax=Streptomyces sp. NPDC051987 TaxID=3155808 RepID=UPI00341B4476